MATQEYLSEFMRYLAAHQTVEESQPPLTTLSAE